MLNACEIEKRYSYTEMIQINKDMCHMSNLTKLSQKVMSRKRSMQFYICVFMYIHNNDNIQTYIQIAHVTHIMHVYVII